MSGFIDNVCLFSTGQLVSFEVTDTDDTTCPIELLEIPVPKCDPDFDVHCSGTKKDKIKEVRVIVFNATFNNISVISW
jgi:hypothetical protein